MKLVLRILACSFILIQFSCVRQSVRSSSEKYEPGEGWNLVWSDEFNGTNLDLSKWSYDEGGGGWGNSELQGYTTNTNNIYLKDGKLVISAERVENNPFYSFSSARINTLGKFSFLYGKIVARIKLPYGLGVWPAFWMMGVNKDSVGWPKCGEIDIMEISGGREYGDSVVYGTAHWYDYEINGLNSAGQTDLNADTNQAEPVPIPFYQDYHIFTLDWDTNSLRWSYDGKEFNYLDTSVVRKGMEAFHKKFYVILNLAIGGRFVKVHSYAEVTAPMPQTMTVDWVRVYQR